MLNAAAAAVVAAAGCGHGGGRPARLLDGRPAAEFAPAPGSVVAAGRILQLSALADCLPPSERVNVPADTPVVERVGVSGRSLTFASRTRVYACDGGIDPAGEMWSVVTASPSSASTRKSRKAVSDVSWSTMLSKYGGRLT